MIRTSKAEWKGSLKDGAGTVALGSGAYEGQYSFSSRFESGTGTNPEELIAAAHAGCFSMALSGALGRAGITPTRIEGIDEATFQEHAQGAKKNCPVSKALGAVEITLDATLV